MLPIATIADGTRLLRGDRAGDGQPRISRSLASMAGS
jgi:hypothetical protein